MLVSSFSALLMLNILESDGTFNEAFSILEDVLRKFKFHNKNYE